MDFQNARKYWNKLSERLKKEGSKVVTNCHRLKLEASDGKKYSTDVADVETLLRLIQLEQKTGKKVISGSNYLPQGKKRLK